MIGWYLGDLCIGFSETYNWSTETSFKNEHLDKSANIFLVFEFDCHKVLIELHPFRRSLAVSHTAIYTYYYKNRERWVLLGHLYKIHWKFPSCTLVKFCIMKSMCSLLFRIIPTRPVVGNCKISLRYPVPGPDYVKGPLGSKLPWE